MKINGTVFLIFFVVLLGMMGYAVVWVSEKAGWEMAMGLGISGVITMIVFGQQILSNIQVNGIGPGYFDTSQTAPIRVDGHPFNDFIISRTPAARWGNPEDLAGATIFLASKASDFINGQIIYVDGGILATIGKPNNEE